MYDDEEEDEDDEEERHSSNNWDKLLDKYESLISQAVPLCKKIATGDMGALKKFIKSFESLEDLNDDLSDAEDDMTAEQCQRYMELSEKFTTAVMGIKGSSGLSEDILDEMEDVFDDLGDMYEDVMEDFEDAIEDAFEDAFDDFDDDDDWDD